MMLSVEIDGRSGFCGGVIRAIGRAEQYLDSHPGERLCSLGEIVHNEAELERLRGLGLVTIDNINAASGRTVLIRAHGEPPATYRAAQAAGIELIDCTCPVVLALQQRIRHSYENMPDGGQLIIFGKVGHPEVLGLLGQVGTSSPAVVVENMQMLEAMLSDGTIRRSVHTEIFSQTTKSPSEYAAICARLRELIPDLAVHDTICSQVASRHEALGEFAAAHDVIFFVSGSSSSNGRVLFELCRSRNPRSYMVGSASEIDPSVLRDGDRVGVCGATSTPHWLLEDVASALENLAK